MIRSWRVTVVIVSSFFAASGTAVAQTSASFAIRDVRVFDGARVLPRATILVRDGRIAAVGEQVLVPAGTTVVEGAGRTLLPGLIDSHTHAFGDVLRTALALGVTTELDQFTAWQQAAAWRTEQAAGRGADRADIYSAGTLVTVPRGHGTEYGMTIATVTDTTNAQAFIEARIAEGSDWIKFVVDDGHPYGMNLPTLTIAQLRPLIAAAHARGKLAVVHIGSQRDARAVIDAGADALVHLFVDEAPAADFGRFAAAHHVFVIPTLTVNESVTGVASGEALLSDSLIAPYLAPDMALNLHAAFPRRANSTLRLEYAFAAVRQLRDAGVPILAGTDAPNPGTTHGASIHRELELLVQAGLTPVEALRAATSAPAAAFRLGDRGTIAVGRRADLVLVEGDPTSDITRTRAIVSVWKAGVAAPRDSLRREMAAARVQPAAQATVAGLVSDFDSDLATRFGSGWSSTTDAMAGGNSAAAFARVAGGASGSAGALNVSGTINTQFAFPWAGVMFSPGPTMFAPADLGTSRSLSFRVKGDGGTYRVMLFSAASGRVPVERQFTAGPEWTEISMNLADFPRVDPGTLQAVIFSGGPRPGPFAFQLDDVRFHQETP